jgi:hypothetical protein
MSIQIFIMLASAIEIPQQKPSRAMPPNQVIPILVVPPVITLTLAIARAIAIAVAVAM